MEPEIELGRHSRNDLSEGLLGGSPSGGGGKPPQMKIGRILMIQVVKHYPGGLDKPEAQWPLAGRPPQHLPGAGAWAETVRLREATLKEAVYREYRSLEDDMLHTAELSSDQVKDAEHGKAPGKRFVQQRKGQRNYGYYIYYEDWPHWYIKQCMVYLVNEFKREGQKYQDDQDKMYGFLSARAAKWQKGPPEYDMVKMLDIAIDQQEVVKKYQQARMSSIQKGAEWTEEQRTDMEEIGEKFEAIKGSGDSQLGGNGGRWCGRCCAWLFDTQNRTKLRYAFFLLMIYLTAASFCGFTFWKCRVSTVSKGVSKSHR
jgi:hypothetical protein